MAQSDSEIVDQYVVRETELDLVLDTIKENVPSKTCQHVLILGQRGSGKTMLLARVVAELRKKNEFHDVLPIRFPEESDEVIDATGFWLEVLRQIANEIRPSNPPMAEDTYATVRDLSERWRDSTAEHQAESAAMRLVQRLGKKVVLLVENLQSLVGTAHESFGWKLREFLQSSSDVMLVGTATSRFKSMDNWDMPFFELFRVINLEPLGTESCEILWQKLTRNRFPSRQIRPLEILTGGNPRLLVVVSNFAVHDSLKRLMDELIRLIDHHTEYFKSRLEEIPTKERIVFLSLLDLWRDSTLSEIATRARMSTQSVSGLLNRLISRGAVLKLGSGRKHIYSVNERLFCFYYKLRYRNDTVAVVEHLVNFMVAFYSTTELRKIRRPVSENATTTHFIHDGLLRAKEELKFDVIGHQRRRNEDFATDSQSSIAALLWLNEILEGSSVDKDQNLDGAESTVAKRQAEHFQRAEDESVFLSHAQSVLKRSSELTNDGDYDAALQLLGGVFSEYRWTGNEFDEWFHAFVVFQIGHLSTLVGRTSDAAYSFDYFVDHFEDSRVPVVQKIFIEALKSQAWALAADNQVTEALEKLETAISYVRSPERAGSLTPESPLVDEDIAHIRLQKSVIQRNEGQLAESLQAINEVLKSALNEGTALSPSLVQTAHIEKGITLRACGNIDQSVQSFDDAIESGRLSESSRWTDISLRAYKEKANSQFDTQPSNALETLDRVIQGSDGTNDEKNRFELVQIFERKMSFEFDQEDLPSAFATSDELYDRFNQDTSQLVCATVCRSLFLRGGFACCEDRWDETRRASRRLNRLICRLPRIPVHNEHRFNAIYLGILIHFHDLEIATTLLDLRNMGEMAEHGSPRMMQSTLGVVRLLLQSDVKETDLIETLSGKSRDELVLRPLVVALRLEVGDAVREPKEILEVAQDVRRQIYGWRETS